MIMRLYFFGGGMEKEKPTILIIDDEKRLLISLSLLLEKDFNILTASNGRGGLSLFSSNHVSLILLDIDMPVMNGLEMLQKIRTADKFVRVIMMTGKSTHDWAKQCADLNVQGYMEKPFDVSDLILKVKELLGLGSSSVLHKLWGSNYEQKFDSVSIPVRRAIDFINENYENEICRENIANHLQLNPDYLSRLFHRECGFELKEYVHQIKIEKSKKLLSSRYDMKVKDVAEAVGISDTAYFCRFFKQRTGLTPMEFRKKELTFSSPAQSLS